MLSAFTVHGSGTLERFLESVETVNEDKVSAHQIARDTGVIQDFEDKSKTERSIEGVQESLTELDELVNFPKGRAR